MTDTSNARTQAKIVKKGGYPAGGTVNVDRPMPTNFPKRPATTNQNDKPR
jgi:hypothetical protein